MVPRGARLTLRLRVPHQLVGPLPAQAVVGTAAVMDGGQVLARIPLVTSRRLDAVSGLTLAVRFITHPLTLLVIVVLIGLGGLRLAGRTPAAATDRPGAELEAA